MSGGVDSSVSAALLVNQGYDVTGAYMVNYSQAEGQCWRADYQDALRVCAKLGISLLKLNFQKEYENLVLKKMFALYKQGLTPNPDILCNKFIKFGSWLFQAKKLGFSYLATGHYAEIKQIGAKLQLACAKDTAKDQTYFLHQLNQNQLKRAIFPLGKYYKPQVRQLALKFKLPTADKKESMGICFVGKVPMKKFLATRLKQKKGPIYLSGSEELIGQHDGLPFYTIGQRHIGAVHSKRPLYVLKKIKSANALVVGYEDDPAYYMTNFKVKNINWISGQKPDFPLQCLVRLRHQGLMLKGEIDKNNKNNSGQVKLAQKTTIAPAGQFAVFYQSGVCLGGGEIA